MALKNTIDHLDKLLSQITNDLNKATGGNKAAAQRVRTGTVKLEKVAKQYRKESIQDENSRRGTSKRSTAKKSTSKTSKASSKSSSKSKAGTARKGFAKASPRAFQLRKPTAKLPSRKFSYAR